MYVKVYSEFQPVQAHDDNALGFGYNHWMLMEKRADEADQMYRMLSC